MALKVISVLLTGDSTSLRSQLALAAREVDAFGNKVGGVGTSAASASKLMAVGFAAAGAAVAGSLAYAVKGAADFEAAMRNVNSISGLSEAAFKAQGDAVLDLSRKLPQSAKTLAEGLYDIASSGFQGAEGLEVLEESAKAASAGLTTTANSAKAITAVLNAYGRGAEDAADVSDVLFQTVNLGVVSFEELTGVIGDTVGAAAAAGIEIDEVGSAIAAMTLSGISASEAGTSLNRVITALIKPSDAMATVLASMGYESGHAAIQANGLRGTMEKLRVATGGNVTTIMELFNEVRGARGAFALMANEGENYRKVSEGITDAVGRQGATQRALNEQMKSLSAQFRVFVNGLNAVAIEVGTKLLPVISDLLSGLQRLGSGGIPQVQSALAALAPFFRSVTEIGADLVNIAKALVDGLGPLGKALGAIVAVGVIEALNVLSGLLADLTGFIEEHSGVITALAVIYGTNLALGIAGAAAQLAVWRLTAVSSAIASSGLALAIQQQVHYFGLLGLALRALPIVAVVGTIASAVTTIADARREADGLADSLAKGLNLSSQGGLDEYLKRINDQREEFREVTNEGNRFTRFLRSVVDVLPLTEAGLVKAQEGYKGLADEQMEAARASISFGENVNTIRHATGLSAEAVEELAKKLGIDLSQSFGKSKDGRDKIIGDFTKMKEAGRQAGVGVKDGAELTKEGIEEMAAAVAEAQKAIEDTAKKVGEVFSSSFDLVSNYAKAAKDHEKATGNVTAAQERLVEAQKNLAQLRERQSVDDKHTISDAQALAAAQDKVTEAQKGVAAANKAVADTSLSAFFAQQVADANKFATDIRRAAEAGLDPAIIKRLLEAGPEQAAPFLQAMLSGHVDRNVQMANESQRSLNEVNAQMIEAARVTQRAINATNTEMAADYEKAMEILAAKAALGGQATAEALAEKLGVGVEEVRRIAQEYVIVLAASINPLLDAIGAVPVYMGQEANGMRTAAGIQQADGGIVNFYAKGGVEDHVAQVAPAGAWRVWAEPETGGEAYIPLAESKRDRSVGILSEVADRFGMALVQYHEGGGTDELGLPFPPSFAGYGDQLGYSARETTKYAYDEAHAFAAEEKRKADERKRKESEAAAGAIGDAEVGSGWREITNYLDSVGQDYTVTSTVRPGAITSSGNLSNHALGKAVDMVGDMESIFRTLLNIGSTLSELFYDPMGYSIKNGARADFIVGGHDDHVHAATFDQGGWLQPGYTMAYNGTGRAERVTAHANGGVFGGTPGSSGSGVIVDIDYDRLAGAMSRVNLSVPVSSVAKGLHDMRRR